MMIKAIFAMDQAALIFSMRIRLYAHTHQIGPTNSIFEASGQADGL